MNNTSITNDTSNTNSTCNTSNTCNLNSTNNPNNIQVIRKIQIIQYLSVYCVCVWGLNLMLSRLPQIFQPVSTSSVSFFLYFFIVLGTDNMTAMCKGRIIWKLVSIFGSLYWSSSLSIIPTDTRVQQCTIIAPLFFCEVFPQSKTCVQTQYQMHMWSL